MSGSLLTSVFGFLDDTGSHPHTSHHPETRPATSVLGWCSRTAFWKIPTSDQSEIDTASCDFTPTPVSVTSTEARFGASASTDAVR
jgi:hypothetical protein